MPSVLAKNQRVRHSNVTPAWIVPGYSPSLSLALRRRGWELRQTYAVLIRSVANRVREPALMPVQA